MDNETLGRIAVSTAELLGAALPDDVAIIVILEHRGHGGVSISIDESAALAMLAAVANKLIETGAELPASMRPQEAPGDKG